MSVENALHYITEQVTASTSNLKITCETAGETAVHDLRVAIKKLSTVSNLVVFCRKEKYYKKHFKKQVRPVFKTAGKIRIAQIEQLLTANYEKELGISVPFFKQKLDAQFKKHLEKLKEQIFSKEDLFLNFGEELKKGVELIEKKDILRFREKVYERTEKNKSRIKSKKLHKQRKLLKEYRYLSEILHPEITEAGTTVLEDLLGKWHDLHEFRCAINQFIKKNKKLPKENRSDLKKMLESVSYEIVIVLEEYLKSFEKIILKLHRS